MVWHFDGDVSILRVKSSNAHNKNIAFLVSDDVGYPNIHCQIEGCDASGSDYEDGILGYANADNLTYKNCIARNCPRNGFTFNRQNSNDNYGENLEAYNCGVGVGFNRGGITDILYVQNIYVEGGGYHDKSGDYQPAIEIKSQITDKCGYIDLKNVGIVCDKQTYAFLIMKAQDISIHWDSSCDEKYKIIQGNLTPPTAYGYFVRIDPCCSNITIDGGGALEVKDFKYLFNIETGSTGVLIKNCSFNDYTNLGTIDSSATFENNCFNDVFYATGYPVSTPSMRLRLLFDASLGVSRTDASVSSWISQDTSAIVASQATGSLQPKWIDACVNGYPVIKGNGTSNTLSLSSTISTIGDFAIFVVMGGTVLPQYMFGHSSTLYTRYISASTTWRNSTLHSFDHINKTLTAKYWIHHFTRLDSSTTVRSYRNGVESSTGGVYNAVAYTVSYLFNYGSTNYGIGALAEYRLYDGSINATDVSTVLNELNTKYNIY